jgi:iron complex outermembrane receptor protein
MDLGQKPLDVTDNLGFFNPKVGLDYRYNSRNSFYVFFGVGNREPTRNDYIDAPDGQPPQHESLYNAEAGYKYQDNNKRLKVNAYYMRYRNQLVNTGEVNDVGANIRTNVDQSYRAGLELIGAIKLGEQWQWQGNATFSRNRILNTDYKVGGELVESFESTPISLSPSIIASSQFRYQPFKGFKASLQSKYVGEQYLDNTGSEDRKIQDYLLNNLRLSYTVNQWAVFDQVTAQLDVNNLLNVRYANDGYTFAARSESGEVNHFNFFYPQAGRNFMASLKLGF